MGFPLTPPKDTRFEVLESIFDLGTSQELVDIIFSVRDVLDSYEKTAAWLITKNGNFGGTSPMALILAGRGHKVLAFIRAVDERMAEENEKNPVY